MADSPFDEADERRTRRVIAVGDAIGSVDKFELFADAVNEFMFAAIQLHEHEGEDSPLLPLAELVDSSVRNMLTAVTDFYVTQVVFDAHLALVGVDEEMARARRRNRRKGRRR